VKERSTIDKDPFDDFGAARGSSKAGDDRPFSRILQEIVNHLTEIIRSEFRLAQTEVRRDLTQVAKASVLFVVAGVFALYALGFILVAAVYALGTVVAPWIAALIVGVGIAMAAAICLQVGRTRMKRASLKPDETIESLQENITWMKKQTR